ncbi:PspA/IM30 family protein [Cohnella thailandensis]|uniref:PspA/IM30 family protein n=1 Tax=Cohnella thailandensis TaxID=557557 RepID=A0A841SW48_9BACL|nr:PspA/IM30 family protein [Cohnella thailandensis]MBB6632941.1 PspA/IM30 family protein [Cohnella thailandensis]MBP1975366.1 phage shock protein A [Cohnella thailandensis]
MSVIKRVRDISAATLNDRLEKSEDPVKLIDQFLWSTHQEIGKSEQLHRQYAVHTEHLYKQWKEAEQWKEKREQQALTALKAGEETAAKLALQDKVIHEEKAERYRGLYEQSQAELNELAELLQELRDEYRAVYDRRQFYVARMESLRLQQRLTARLGESGYQGNTRTMFRRLDDQITDMELESKSLRDLRRMGTEMLYTAGTAVQEVIERELQQLKRKLQQDQGG